ncbi:hypothetical protein [Bradyrhizobium liaoningense]|uniref:hypothetical protein n=1 Tax=Bradyrhizobium liaoningense TaxID=43992 RepID=UPI001BA57D4C|nr:hypothetical protein [Bradyrhizobium liaoningense]MBR0708365.1 hypothetical protein [Bradyrhizobium liaoningense]
MVLVNAPMIPVMLFFLFLPISDCRTVRMRLGALCALLALLSVSVISTNVAPVQLAGIVTAR